MNFKPCPTLKKNYILKRNGVQKKNERKIKVQMIWYLYPTHAYRKPSALVFHLIEV